MILGWTKSNFYLLGVDSSELAGFQLDMGSEALRRCFFFFYIFKILRRIFLGITKVHVPYDRVWRPDIILYNNAASDYSKSVLSTDIIVSYDGNVSWTMAGIFKSSCELDVRYYPFDYQVSGFVKAPTFVPI